MERKPLTFVRSREDILRTRCIPVVAGWRYLKEREELTNEQAIQKMRVMAQGWTGKVLSVHLKAEQVEWNEDPVLNVYSGDQLLGCIPPALTDHFRSYVMRALKALVSLRGKTVYVVMVG